MAEWWELDEAALADDVVAQEAMQMALYNTFYATTQGRQVLLSLQRRCYARQTVPEATLALICFYNKLRADCGITASTEMQALEAESKYINLENKE